ncbi:unnamed protein product, partial [Rotaria sp. Silwood1]
MEHEGNIPVKASSN